MNDAEINALSLPIDDDAFTVTIRRLEVHRGVHFYDWIAHFEAGAAMSGEYRCSAEYGANIFYAAGQVIAMVKRHHRDAQAARDVPAEDLDPVKSDVTIN